VWVWDWCRAGRGRGRECCRCRMRPRRRRTSLSERVFIECRQPAHSYVIADRRISRLASQLALRMRLLLLTAPYLCFCPAACGGWGQCKTRLMTYDGWKRCFRSQPSPTLCSCVAASRAARWVLRRTTHDVNKTVSRSQFNSIQFYFKYKPTNRWECNK